MRHRPAHSIRARELVSQIQADCKGAFFTRDPEPKISLGMQGRPCKRSNKNLAAVALANKTARIVWALLAHGRSFRADYRVPRSQAA